MIEHVLQFLIDNPPGPWIGPLLGAVAFVETLFPPFPGDVLFVVLSGWAMAGGTSLPVAALSGLLGCFAASCILFYLGRSPGRRFVDGWLSRHIDPERIGKAKELIASRGPVILAGSRFIPGVRSLLVLMAGTSGMHFSTAVLPIAASATAWYAILSVGGRIVGNNLAGAEGFMRHFEIWIWVLLAVVLVVLLLFRRGRKGGSSS